MKPNKITSSLIFSILFLIVLFVAGIRYGRPYFKSHEGVASYTTLIDESKKYIEIADSSDTSEQPSIKKQKAMEEECHYVINKQLEYSKSIVNNNNTTIEIIKNNCLQVDDSSFTTDFDKDGQKEVVLITAGAGCVSCHIQEIRIIKDNKVIFYKDGSDFWLKLVNDHSGFTLQYPVTDLSDPESGYIIESYKAKISVNGVEYFDKVSEEKKSYVFD